MPSFSRNLEEALHRAVAYANQRKHEYATLEHLLLSLADDEDAAGVMKAYATTYKNRSRDLLQEFSTTDNYPSLAGVLEEAVTTEARRADMLGLFPDAAVRDSAVRFDPGAATATP